MRIGISCVGRGLVCAVLVLAGLPVGAEQAGTSDTSPANALDEVTVTARRVSENQQTVPVAVTALSGDALENRVITQVSDLQNDIPNLQIRPSTP